MEIIWCPDSFQLFYPCKYTDHLLLATEDFCCIPIIKNSAVTLCLVPDLVDISAIQPQCKMRYTFGGGTKQLLLGGLSIANAWSSQLIQNTVLVTVLFPEFVILLACNAAGVLRKQNVICTKQKHSQDTYQFCNAINTSTILIGIPLQFWLSTIKFWQVFPILFIDLVSHFALLMIFPSETARKPLGWCRCCQVWKGHQHKQHQDAWTIHPCCFLARSWSS